MTEFILRTSKRRITSMRTPKDPSNCATHAHMKTDVGVWTWYLLMHSVHVQSTTYRGHRWCINIDFVFLYDKQLLFSHENPTCGYSTQHTSAVINEINGICIYFCLLPKGCRNMETNCQEETDVWRDTHGICFLMLRREDYSLCLLHK